MYADLCSSSYRYIFWDSSSSNWVALPLLTFRGLYLIPYIRFLGIWKKVCVIPPWRKGWETLVQTIHFCQRCENICWSCAAGFMSIHIGCVKSYEHHWKVLTCTVYSRTQDVMDIYSSRLWSSWSTGSSAQIMFHMCSVSCTWCFYCTDSVLLTFSMTYVIFKLSVNAFYVHLVFKLVTLCVCMLACWGCLLCAWA
jgi:hypothetical protein